MFDYSYLISKNYLVLFDIVQLKYGSVIIILVDMIIIWMI